MMRNFSLITLWMLACSQMLFGQKVANPPPEQLPVKVETTFHIWHLSDINEKEGTFSATIYLETSWHDPRLAFSDTDKAAIYTDKSAVKKLEEIWWPMLDFVNASHLEMRNQTLVIYPDGRVEYHLKILGSFFNDMDLRKFPFDEQDYAIHIESFLWNSKVVEFVISKTDSQALSNLNIKSMRPTQLSGEVSQVQFLDETYSDVGVNIHFIRDPSSFYYQILIPLLIVLFITCMMFNLGIDDLAPRLLVAQGSILVLVAMKFMINQDLPNVDYLIFVDYIFFIAYFYCLILVIFSFLDYLLKEKYPHFVHAMNRNAAWITLLVCLIVYIIAFYLVS